MSHSNILSFIADIETKNDAWCHISHTKKNGNSLKSNDYDNSNNSNDNEEHKNSKDDDIIWDYEFTHEFPYFWIKGPYSKSKKNFIGDDHIYECKTHELEYKGKIIVRDVDYFFMYDGITTTAKSKTKYKFERSAYSVDYPLTKLEILEFPTRYEPSKWDARTFEVWIYNNENLSKDDYLNFIKNNNKHTTIEQFKKKYIEDNEEFVVLDEKIKNSYLKIMNELKTIAVEENKNNEKIDKQTFENKIYEAYITQLRYVENVTHNTPNYCIKVIDKITKNLEELKLDSYEQYKERTKRELYIAYIKQLSRLNDTNRFDDIDYNLEIINEIKERLEKLFDIRNDKNENKEISSTQKQDYDDIKKTEKLIDSIIYKTGEFSDKEIIETFDYFRDKFPKKDILDLVNEIIQIRGYFYNGENNLLTFMIANYIVGLHIKEYNLDMWGYFNYLKVLIEWHKFALKSYHNNPQCADIHYCNADYAEKLLDVISSKAIPNQLKEDKEFNQYFEGCKNLGKIDKNYINKFVKEKKIKDPNFKIILLNYDKLMNVIKIINRPPIFIDV